MSAPPDAASIREATAEDAATLAEIARAAYAKYVPLLGRELPPMLADFPAHIAAGTVIVIGAATPAGYLIGWPEADAYLIDNVAIDPRRQGEGLGRRLIAHATGEARRLRLHAVRIYTNEVMTENQSIYRHLGFVETRRAIENGFRRVHMRLAL